MEEGSTFDHCSEEVFLTKVSMHQSVADVVLQLSYEGRLCGYICLSKVCRFGTTGLLIS